MDDFTQEKIEFAAVRKILGGFCASAPGRALALRIGPSRNPETIGRRLRQTTQMIAAMDDVGLPPFAGVSDIAPALDRAKPSGGATAEDFAQIASALEAAANLRQYLAALPEKLSLLHELTDGIGTFGAEIEAIAAVVGPDGEVRDDASRRLGELRRRIARIAREIHDVIYGYLRKPEVRRLLQDARVTLNGDRYVLPVKAENRGRLGGVVHRTSNTGATVFVEPNACVELNNRLADLSTDERREVQRLLNDLCVRIGPRRAEITDTMRAVAQVDLLSAKAQYARRFDMTCPEMTERGSLQLSQARHPLLLERARQLEADGQPADDVVPIDVRLGSDFDILVLTGSNTGGKTVAMKTVALLATMAQSGMHVPAQRGAALPVFRDIFLDVGDEQSLEQSLSTFGAHVKRLRHILRKADRSCLVLLDELGAGTDPDEGGAIGQAVLDELRHIGCLAMATTHLSVLKAYAFVNDRVDNASVEFDTNTLRPTYRLLIGRPGQSHAIAVAQRLGLSRRLISAARRHLGRQGKQFRRAIQATSAVRKSAEEARIEATRARLDAQGQAEMYESKLADLHRLQGEFETWLASLAEMNKGDELFVPSLNKTGRLVRLELHRQLAVVDADNMQVEVPLSQLMPALGQDEMRRQIAALRKQILDQAATAEANRAETQRIRDEYRRSIQAQRRRTRQHHEHKDAGKAASRPDRKTPPMPRRHAATRAARSDRRKLLNVQPGQQVFVIPFNKRATVIRMDVEKELAVVQSGIFEMEIPLADLEPVEKQ